MTRHLTTHLAAIVLAGVLVAVVGCRSTDPADPAGPRPRPEPAMTRAAVAEEPRPARMAAAEALRAWDRDRADAYARGSVAALRDLYLPGSRAGAADVAVLRDYRRRGLRVAGMRTQLLSVEVLHHDEGSWRLRVVDRLHGAVAVAGDTAVPLPRDTASGHLVTLRREAPGSPWLVASVRPWSPAPRDAASDGRAVRRRSSGEPGGATLSR